MGVMLYILLSGIPPFYGNSDLEIVNMIKIGEFNYERNNFINYSYRI